MYFFVLPGNRKRRGKKEQKPLLKQYEVQLISHRVVGAAPEPPSVTSVSVQETSSSICVHGGGVPRRVRGAVQKSSPPPLRPRAPFHNPPGPPCAAVVAPSGPGRAPLALPAALPQAQLLLQTWRIGSCGRAGTCGANDSGDKPNSQNT
jgi:hypothetical protein